MNITNLICYFAVFTIGLSVSIPGILTPIWVENIGLDTSTIGLFYGLQTIASLISGFVLGHLADRRKKAPLLLFALSLYIIGLLVMTNANSVFMVALGLLVIGPGHNGMVIISSAHLVQAGGKNGNLYIARLNLAFSISAVIGPWLMKFIGYGNIFYISIFIASIPLSLIVMISLGFFKEANFPIAPLRTKAFDSARGTEDLEDSSVLGTEDLEVLSVLGTEDLKGASKQRESKIGTEDSSVLGTEDLPQTSHEKAEIKPATILDFIKSPVLWFVGFAVLAYSGIEGGLVAWMPYYFANNGQKLFFEPALWNSWYFFTFMIGRLIYARIVQKVNPFIFIFSMAAFMLLPSILWLVFGSGMHLLVQIALLGLFCAGIYPAIQIVLAYLMPGSMGMAGIWMMIFGSFANMLWPALTGRGLSMGGIYFVPLMLLVQVGILFTMIMLIRKKEAEKNRRFV